MILGFLTNYFSEKNLEKRRKEIYSKQNALEQEITKLEDQKRVFDSKIVKKIQRSKFYYKIYTETANTVIAHAYDFFNQFNDGLLPNFYDLLKHSVTINCSKNEISLIKSNIDLLNKDIETAERMIDLYGYLDNTKQIYYWLINNHSYELWVNNNRETPKKAPKSISTMTEFLKEILSKLDESIIAKSERTAINALMKKLKIFYKYKHIIRAQQSALKYYKKEKSALFDEIKQIKKTLELEIKKYDELAEIFSKKWKELVKRHHNICRGFKKAEELNLEIGYICSQKNIAAEELQKKINNNSSIMKKNKRKKEEIDIKLQNIRLEQKDESTRLRSLDHGDDDTAHKIKKTLANLSNNYDSLNNNRDALTAQNEKLYKENEIFYNEIKPLSDAFDDLMKSYKDSVSSIFSFPKEIEKKLPENIYSDQIKTLFFLNDNYTKKENRQKLNAPKIYTQEKPVTLKNDTQSEKVKSIFDDLFKLLGGK